MMITRELIQTLLETCRAQEEQARQIHHTTTSEAEFHQSEWEAFSYSYQRYAIEQMVANYSQEFWEDHLLQLRKRWMQEAQLYDAIVKNPPAFGASQFDTYKRAGMRDAYQWMYQKLCGYVPASLIEQEHHEIVVELGAVERSRIERFGGRSQGYEIFLPDHIERRESCAVSLQADSLVCCFILASNEHLHILSCTYGPPVTPMTITKHFCRSVSALDENEGRPHERKKNGCE